MIDNAYHEYEYAKIIDVGGTRQYWNIVPIDYLKNRNAHITVVNISGAPLPDHDDIFRFVHGDGCDLPLDDNSYHIAHSNSVIEHVGDWSRKVQFANEIKRIGQSYFVQTPNYWFPIEPHCMTPCFHWLPKPWRVALVRMWSLGNYRKALSVGDAVSLIESAQILNRKMFAWLFDDAEIITERCLGLPKSFIAVGR